LKGYTPATCNPLFLRSFPSPSPQQQRRGGGVERTLCSRYNRVAGAEIDGARWERGVAGVQASASCGTRPCSYTAGAHQGADVAPASSGRSRKHRADIDKAPDRTRPTIPRPPNASTPPSPISSTAATRRSGGVERPLSGPKIGAEGSRKDADQPVRKSLGSPKGTRGGSGGRRNPEVIPPPKVVRSRTH
jgi:hypothetical protein